MGSRAVRIVLGVALAVVVLDRLTKAWALANLDPERPVDLLGPFLRLHLVHNPGAAFSFLTNATWVFTLIAVAISGYLIRFAPRIQHPVWAAAVGGILGGALGNLIDRLANPPSFGQGHVTDFLELPYWPIFNVADSSIVISAVVVVLMSLRGFEMDGSRPAHD